MSADSQTKAQRLAGRVVAVTGAGRGIGRAIATRCAAEGAHLVVVDRDEEALTQTAALIGGCDGICHSVAGDIADEATVVRMIDTAMRCGGLDGLVNNAAISGAIKPFDAAGQDEFERIVAVNVRPVWRALQLAREALRANGRGAVVNVASMAALRANHGLALYGMTKGAVANLTMNAALEYARDPIRVNAVCPGPIDTDMMGLMEAHLDARHSEVARRQIAATTPMRRYGRPAEVAAAVAFLLCDDASFITGVLLPVDGGLSIR